MAPLESDSAAVAKVASVNVGAVRTVEWAGRQVQTGIWKAPVAGRVSVEGVNLHGDDQADRRVHGGPDMAIYAYADEDYRWWSGELGEDLGPATFGENLTTAGIDLQAAVIGERWTVGTTVLEVSQPRGMAPVGPAEARPPSRSPTRTTILTPSGAAPPSGPSGQGCGSESETRVSGGTCPV